MKVSYDLKFEKFLDLWSKAEKGKDKKAQFLHRNHDCERGIGTAHRYNISNSAELILKSGKQDSSMAIIFDIRDIFNNYK